MRLRTETGCVVNNVYPCIHNDIYYTGITRPFLHMLSFQLRNTISPTMYGNLVNYNALHFSRTPSFVRECASQPLYKHWLQEVIVKQQHFAQLLRAYVYYLLQRHYSMCTMGIIVAIHPNVCIGHLVHVDLTSCEFHTEFRLQQLGFKMHHRKIPLKVRILTCNVDKDLLFESELASYNICSFHHSFCKFC